MSSNSGCSKPSGESKMKRSFLSCFELIVCLAFVVGTTRAQQTDTPKAPASKKPTAAQAPEKPGEPAAKPQTPSEEKPAIREVAGDKDKEKDKEERYDMTEVPPVATHHQITVDGKALRYTATAGRLPLKRDDGKTQALMFYVAYTLDGQDAAKR